MAELNETAELQVQATLEPSGAVLVSVEGELDVSNARQLESAVARATDEHKPSELVFDLAGLRFMDSAGIAVLLGATKRVERVSLRQPSPIVRRVVELTGLSAVLPVAEQ
jgi:stage II sporulation protein AA (anti-sigma F factor antagonist)